MADGYIHIPFRWSDLGGNAPQRPRGPMPPWQEATWLLIVIVAALLLSTCVTGDLA